jgi:hypothetical protein
MPILIIMCVLLLYGLLALLSVSVHESFTTTLMLVSKGKLLEPTNYFYFFRQLQYVVLALCVGR